MMFTWKPEMIRFMTDASEQSDFHSRLAQIILQHLGPGGHICDAGCGLGYLSRALSPYYDRITSIDISQAAIASLQDQRAQGLYPNISPICGDIHHIQPEPLYDHMVFCLFGQIEEIFQLARQQCRGKVVIIKKNWPCHAFSLTQQPNQNLRLEELCQCLDRQRIPYFAQSCTLELPQPLRTVADGVRFFQLYSRDPNPASITAEQVLPRLKPGSNPAFPFLLPAQKKLGILIIPAQALPDRLCLASS